MRISGAAAAVASRLWPQCFDSPILRDGIRGPPGLRRPPQSPGSSTQKEYLGYIPDLKRDPELSSM